MIKNIFIPEKINGYYPLSKRILGFSIQKLNIYATQIVLNKRNITIEKLFHAPLNGDISVPYSKRVSDGIQDILKKAKGYDEIRSAIPSSQVVFKKLTVPFIDLEKIKMILEFEVEPFLPFPIAEAVLDCIVLSQDPEKKQSEILIAAVQKKYIAEHMSYFEQAKKEPSVLTVDLFDLFGLYTLIPPYAELQNATALVVVHIETTQILYIVDNTLTFIRTLPKGLLDIAKQIGQSRAISPAQAMEELMRFGLEPHHSPETIDAIQKSIDTFWQEIQFSLDSFNKLLTENSPLKKILLLGQISDIPNIFSYIEKTSGVSCALFDINKIVQQKQVSFKEKNSIPSAYAFSLGTAIPSEVTRDLNLRKDEFAVSDTGLFTAQLLTAIGLSLIIIVLFFVYTYWQTRALEKNVNQAKQEVVEYLSDINLAEEPEGEQIDLNDIAQEAEAAVASKENIWFAFSSQTRFSFLKYLQELSTAIDQQAIGLNLKKLVITTDKIILDGSVKDIKSLQVFERELRKSNIFTSVPTLQDTTFDNLELTLKKTIKDEA